MRRHHTGSGRRTVFPDGWQEHHAGVVAAAFASTVTIGDPSTSTKTFNDTTGKTEVIPGAPIYSGAAMIAMVSDPRVLDVVDQPEGTSLYQVELPLEVGSIAHGLVVQVTDSPDPALVGRDLVVDGSQLGDRRFSRFLHAILHD